MLSNDMHSMRQSSLLVSEGTVHGDASVSIVRGYLCQYNLRASTSSVSVEMPDCYRKNAVEREKKREREKEKRKFKIEPTIK